MSQDLAAPSARTGPRRRLTDPATYYVLAVVVGAVLFVVAALKQPFSYDELTQISTYGSWNPITVASATRQPPLAPLLESLVQHLLGVGQLQQRLLPVLAGVGSLVVMSLLLRRLGLRFAGAAAVLVMATAPLMVRYSAYTRPYAEPLFAMLLLAWAILCWLDEGRPKWLWTVGVTAFALPLIRVPEPSAYLLATAVVLAYLSWRGKLPWQRTKPVIILTLTALVTIGITGYVILAHRTKSLADTSPSGILTRIGPGLHEMRTAFVPLLGHSFPWWPVTAFVVVAALAIGASRRRLLSWPMWLPLIAGPVAFALAYHLASKIAFDALPYRDRFASFFVPSLVLCVAALASVAEGPGPRPLRYAAGALVAAMFLTQLPATATVLTADAAPDFGTISQVLRDRVPADAIVLYDRPTPAGASRQPFMGKPRYLGAKPYVATVSHLPGLTSAIPAHGPVYLLFNGQCAYPGRCVPGRHLAIDDPIAGYRVIYRQDRFTLYAPTAGQDGHPGAVAALESSARALGVDLGYVQTFVAAGILKDDGQGAKARALLADLRAHTTPGLRSRMQAELDLYHLDPFGPTFK